MPPRTACGREESAHLTRQPAPGPATPPPASVMAPAGRLYGRASERGNRSRPTSAAGIRSRGPGPRSKAAGGQLPLWPDVGVDGVQGRQRVKAHHRLRGHILQGGTQRRWRTSWCCPSTPPGAAGPPGLHGLAAAVGPWCRAVHCQRPRVRGGGAIFPPGHSLLCPGLVAQRGK